MTANRLSALKSSQLKHAAFLLGLPSTGTKAILEPSINGRLNAPNSVPSGGRVVSVDMGIRNLAYCVLEYPDMDATHARQPLKITAWRKRDLLQSASTPLDTGNVLTGQEDETAATQGKARRKTALAGSISNAAFTPSVLSHTAYGITKDLLSYEPTAILIERQRFRSGGAAAIQEWTVRVNMLESMLWACLRTMSQSQSSKAGEYPDVHEVNPARVANFWTAGPKLSLRPSDDLFSPTAKTAKAAEVTKSTRAKVQKKDKIAIVRSWLEGSRTDVLLAFEGEAAQVAERFRVQAKRRGRNSEATESGMGNAKLDDLADCLLQAVAWVRWEENRVEMMRLLRMD